MAESGEEVTAEDIEAAHEFNKWAHSFLIPVRIAKIEDAQEVSYDQASGIFIRLNGHVYLLTAWHVLERFEERQLAGEDVVLVMEGVASSKPLMFSLPQDIGLVWIPEERYGGITSNIFNAESNWSPTTVLPDDTCVFIGFPRAFSRDDGNVIEHGDFSLGLPVASVGEGYVMLQVNEEQMISLGREGLPASDVSLGGLSGCPVFGVRPPIRFLAGIVSQAPQGLPLFRISTLEALDGFTPHGRGE